MRFFVVRMQGVMENGGSVQGVWQARDVRVAGSQLPMCTGARDDICQVYKMVIIRCKDGGGQVQERVMTKIWCGQVAVLLC